MSTKILLIGARLCRNLGGPSLLPTTMHVLNKFFDNPEYTFISPTTDDLPLAEKYNTTILANPVWKNILMAALLKASLRLNWGTLSTRQVIQAFLDADIIIDIWGIGFSDMIGQDTFKIRAFQGIHLLVGKIFRKTIIKYTASLGPFKAKWNRFFSRIYLQRCVDLILAREQITQQRINKLGITTPVQVCPDSAFLLEPQSTSLAKNLASQKNEHPIIGLSISHMAATQSNNPDTYLDNMAALADYVIKNTDAQLVLIPNEISRNTESDDFYYTKEMWKRMKSQNRVIFLDQETTGPELKGIIGQCDTVIAARYHTIVASLSQGIPVLATTWHAKYIEVLSLFDLEDYYCSVNSLSLESLKAKFNNLWESKHLLSKKIKERLPIIHEAILAGGETVHLLYKNKNNRPKK